jgi:uncharacterized protein
MKIENFKLKEILMVISGIFIIVLIFYFGVKTFNETDNNMDQQNVISVAGLGEVFAKPDIAEISLSVEKEAVLVIDAQKSATDAANKVVAFLKQSGIEDKDIKTTNYNIYPRYDYLKTGQVLRGYVVSQTLDVKIRKIDDAGKILGGATLAGANQVGGINFTIDDMEAVKREARQAAINDAKEKAKQLAKDLGVRMGKLINYSENGNGYILPMYSDKTSVLGMGGGVEAPVPQIPSGENKVTINVTLTYGIK